MQFGDGTLRDMQLRRATGGRLLFKDIWNKEANNRLLRETYSSVPVPFHWTFILARKTLCPFREEAIDFQANNFDVCIVFIFMLSLKFVN